MAEPNVNPAPENVSSIGGQQGIDLSGIMNYDDNTSLDDIAGAYNSVGQQMGQIVNQAAEHVGDIQTKLIGNNFGSVSPYMYDTYYEPGANSLQSDWRAQGAQKALSVGMDRGKKAAEAAAKSAQDRYNNAVNDYNKAVEDFKTASANPTIATVDLSGLGKDNTVTEIEEIKNLPGNKVDAQNKYIDETIEQTGVVWDDKSERWSLAAKETMKNAGVSQEEYDSWDDARRQAFWDDSGNSIYFKNRYAEDYVYWTMGEEAFNNYRESFQSAMDYISGVWDYAKGVVAELNVEPIKVFTTENSTLQEAISKDEVFNQITNFNDNEINWSEAYKAITKEGGWIDKNIQEQYRDEVRSYVDERATDTTQYMNKDGTPRKQFTKDQIEEFRKFAYDKVTDEYRKEHGGEIETSVKQVEDTNNYQKLTGFDVNTLLWYKSMEKDHPEMLDVLSNQLAQAYGQSTAIEIADGEKWYLVNGEYVQPKAGTVILFAMPGVMNDDGTFANKDYENFVDCFKKLNNAAANYSDEEIKNLQNAMQESWNKYFESIYTTKIAEGLTGTTMDADMYKSVMYRMDPEKYADLTINGTKISDTVKEWKELADKDGHKAYTNLANLLLQSYSKAGFFYAKDANGNLVQYNLNIGKTGESTVGQVTLGNGDENPYKDMTAGEAMALYNVVTTSLQEYQRGNGQDKNINPYFLDDDNAGWWQEAVNSTLNMFGGMIDFASAGISTIVAAIGNLFIPEDKRMDPRDNKGLSIRSAIASLWPENWGKDYYGDLVNGVSWNEMWSEGPKKGTLDYFVQMSDLQQQNLADAINPFMMELWFPEEGQTPDTSAISRIGEGYTSRTKGIFDLGQAAAFDVYGLNTMFANGTAFSESTAKLVGGLVGGYMTGWLTSGAKEIAVISFNKIRSGAQVIADKLATAAAIREINNTSQAAIAEGVAQRTLVQTAEQQAAKSSFGGTAKLGSGIKNNLPAGAGAATSKEMAIRASSELALSDNLPQLTEGFSTEFLEHSFGGAKTAAPMASGMFTTEQAQTLAVAEEAVGRQAAEAVLRETLQQSTLSLGTGLPTAAFENMNAATQRLFTNAYNAVVNGTASTAAKGTLSAANFLKGLGLDGIKEAAVKVAEESAAAVARGMKWTSSDTFRVLSQMGWDGASTRALLTDFAQDFYIDMIRDTMRNASNAYLTNEGWQKQTPEEYFTNPYTYVQNLTFSAIHFGGQRISAQVKDAYYSNKYNKALEAYNAAGDAEAQKAAMNRLNGIINKIQKNSATLVRRGQPYSKLKNSTEKINEDLNYVITKQYEKSGINPITGDSTERFDSSDDFEAYLKDKRISTNDRINLALRGLTIETQNNYIIHRYELGGNDQTKLGNIKNWRINWDMQDIEQRTLDKYYDEVLHGGGTIMERQQKMYKLYTDAIMEKYGKVIPGLEAALNNYYGKYLTDLEIRLKKNPKAQWTLGYTSLAGMTTLGDDSGDVMFGASFSNNFNTVDRNAADVDKSRGYRELKRMLLDAIANGDEELTLPGGKFGKGKTYKLNKDGLNYLKTITAYNNSNTVHKYFDPVFGDSVQTHEHGDQKPFATRAYEQQDAVIMGTKIATQAAESDAAKAQKIISDYTELAYNRYKGTAEEGFRAARNKEIVDANRVLNIADSDHLYKLSQDRTAAERYLQQINEQKHGALEHKYKDVLPRIAEIDGEIGKVLAQREYVQAVNNAKSAIASYLKGDLTKESPEFTIKYGENESIKVNLDSETVDMIATAASSGGEFTSDLAMQMLTTKRNAVQDRPVPGSINEEVARGDYTRIIQELQYDQKVNPDVDHTATIIKLRQEMKAKGIRHNFRSGKGVKGSENDVKSVVEYGYKEMEGTPLDTAKTGFIVGGKEQLVKDAADFFYVPPKAGQKGGTRRAQVMEAAAKPFVDFLTADGQKLTVQDQRMIAYVQNAAEQSLRNMDTGEEPLHITVGTLKREMMKFAPDADLWMTGKNSGAIERVASLSKNGIQPEAMIAELKNIIAANSKMSTSTKSKFVDTVELYELMAENANSIKSNAFSLDAYVKSDGETTTYGDLMAEADTLSPSLANSTKYEKAELKRMIQSAGDVLTQISNKKSPYYSQLVKKTYNDLSSSSNIAKEVKKDFKTLAFDHYKTAVKNPTPENAQFVEAARSWAVARSEADPRAPKLENGKLDLSKVEVNEIDCINALGAANHEVMLSAYGDKEKHTYAEYMAATNNVRGYNFDDDNGMYSPQASDYIRLHNSTYGQSIEQAENGVTRLIKYFPDEKAQLLKKQQSYNLEGNRVAAQYMSDAQLARKIKTEAGESLNAYGLGNLKANRYSDALKAAGRLRKAKTEQDFLAGRPISETWLGMSSGESASDLSVVPWKTRYDANGEEDKSATISAFKRANEMMNNPASLPGEIEPGVTARDYNKIVDNARRELAVFYREAGFQTRGRVSSENIDAFGDKILDMYDTITNQSRTSIASDLLTLNSVTRDNAENAFTSVMANTYDESARTTFDAQTKLLENRSKDLKRRISKLPKTGKSYVTPVVAEPVQTQAPALAEVVSGKITPEITKANPDKVYLFGDNIEDAKSGYVPTSTQAVIRGQENAIGIPTKKNRGTSEGSYFTDADFDEFKKGVDDAISAARKTGKQIVIPEDGIGTGKAQLQKRAPKCFNYLTEQLNSLKQSTAATDEALGQTVATVFDRDVKVVNTGGGFKTNHPNGGRSWLRNTSDGYLLDVDAMHNAFDNRTWRNPQRSEKLNVDFDSEEDMLTFGLLHERGHDFLGTKAKKSEAKAFETKVNNWAEKHYNENTPEYKVARKTARNILRQVLSPADLLNRQLGETEATLQRHLALDSEAMVRDGKMHFYTDQQVLSGEFGRNEAANIMARYSNADYPEGLEIGEGKVYYTVNPANDEVDVSAKNSKGNKNGKISQTKLHAYLFDKAAEIRNSRGEYYDNFILDSKNYTDNGDGTYTIIGSYGYDGMDLHEQERLSIKNWDNIDRSDINAEQKAILDLSTRPIYQSYDEMIDLEKLERLKAERKKLDTEANDVAEEIVALNQLNKSTYDKYIQLTNALGKEYLDSGEATAKYRKALNKELKSYKIDDLDQQTIKSNLSAKEYDEFIDAQRTLFEVARFQNSKDNGVYHAKNGVLFVKDGYNPTGFVDSAVAKAILEGNAVDTKTLEGEELVAALSTKENKKARKEMQKAIDKNQNKGSIHWKNAEEYKAVRESAMDKLSARYTLNNYIEFENQTRDMLTGMGLADDEYKVLMAKDYSDMLQRIAGNKGSIQDAKIIGKFFDTMTHAANLNKAIQDWQLAGGFSNYNAASIAQIRGAIFNDPRAALLYLQVFADAKNSNHAMNSVVQAREFLYKMVARTGDGSLITDLNAAISTTPGQGDMGTVNSLISRMLKHINGEGGIEGKTKVGRAYSRFADDMDALFSDATFKNTFPLFKLRMLQVNYDEALRYFKSFKGWEKYDAHDIEDACMWMSYAKTMDFLEPRKTRGSSWEEFTKNIANDELRKAAASWTGAKRNASLMDNASNVFFALRWKMTFGGRVLNGITNTPGAIMRKIQLRNADISDPEVLATASKQFMRSGNTTGVATMLVLSSIAMLWNKSLGYNSVSWDDLNIIGEDGEFQVPNILKKFQTLGQFWFPNGTNTEGKPIIDPTKKMFGVDPFSSIFTMSNTVAKTFDKLVNPNAYAKTKQRGIVGSHSSSDAINGFINSPFFQAIGDELIASNLLSPYKAMYEVIVDDTYFGNNIWEKRKLADGSDNPNYDPFRNVVASIAHILNFDFMLGGTNRWVKGYGTDKYVNTGKIGTVAGSGVFQHEFITAAVNIMNGEALEGIIEAGELPIKTKNISSSARTDFNVRVKNIVSQYVQEYKDKVGDMVNLDAKDKEYAKLVQRCADTVAEWSKKNEFVLGKDQELVAYVTKTLMAICAGEYNDNLDYVQNAYWKATQIAQIEQSEDLFLGDPDLERYINEGKSVEEFAAEKNRRSEAYNQAIDDEYQARVALKEAGLPDSFLQAYEDVYGSTSMTNFKTEMRSVNRRVFAEVHGVLEGQIGEFKNFKEMKSYYESQIEAATSTKQKAKLADKYNAILKEAISPYIEKYGAAILSDGYYNNQNLANSIAEYVILPADEYYYGKTPRASYLRDQFGVGYRNKDNLPSDKEVYEKYTNALKRVHEGASASASAMLDRLIRDYRNGRTYISASDYSKIVRLKAQLNARSNQ